MTSREQEAKDMLQTIAKDIQKLLPENFGFVFLAYEFGDNDDRTMLYTSNSERDDVCKAMLDFVTKTNNNYGKDV
jgi:hypothetical protein